MKRRNFFNTTIGFMIASFLYQFKPKPKPYPGTETIFWVKDLSPRTQHFFAKHYADAPLADKVQLGTKEYAYLPIWVPVLRSGHGIVTVY